MTIEHGSVRALALRKALAVAFGACAALAGCNGVLGITEAKLDNSLADAATGDTGTSTLRYDCPSYCDAIAKTCTGARLQYTGQAACLEMCHHFDTGSPGDQAGDSLACRVYHTTAAAKDPDTHCPHAGPLGGTHCGDLCEAFCLLDSAICRDFPAYKSEAECRSICPKYPYVSATDGGVLSLQNGPTLNCRLYHLESATEDRQTHCPHTSLSNVHCSIPADAGLE